MRKTFMANLFVGDSKLPFPQPFACNLVEICPKCLVHDTVPTWLEWISSSYRINSKPQSISEFYSQRCVERE